MFILPLSPAYQSLASVRVPCSRSFKYQLPNYNHLAMNVSQSSKFFRHKYRRSFLVGECPFLSSNIMAMARFSHLFHIIIVSLIITIAAQSLSQLANLNPAPSDAYAVGLTALISRNLHLHSKITLAPKPLFSSLIIIALKLYFQQPTDPNSPLYLASRTRPDR